MSPITRLAATATALCGALLLTAACADGKDAPEPPGTSAPSERASIFDKGVNIAVKFDQPGFNYKDNRTQKYAGFENDLANFLDGQLDFPDMSPNDEPSWRREEVLVKDTAQLVIATYSITEERERKIDFAGPYFETRQGLLVQADDTSITSRESTAGKLVCTVRGSVSAPDSSTSDTGDQLAELLPEARINDTRSNYSECVDLLRKGDIDAVWTDQIVLHGFAERHDDVRVVEGLEIGSPQLYGIGIRDGREEDCERIAEALREFLASSDWRDSFESHFPRLAEEDEQFEQHYKPDPSLVDDYSCSDD
ncbi:transporter substrate-binding domain-containing protein [Streptomyces macrosporus]|uniref:Glutamate ABC transporter substrate-binding protein n=1 Tax=Streptomyces macrosporus TaxID=44032 RepID=A0ABP5WSN8_9ACTN